MYRLMTAGIGLAAIAIIAFGCGGGGSDQALTKAQFIAQVKAICAKTHKEVGAVLVGERGKTDPFGRVASLLKQEAEEMEALTGPEKVEAKVKPLIGSVAQASGLLAQEGKKAIEDGRIEAYKHEAQELNLPNC